MQWGCSLSSSAPASASAAASAQAAGPLSPVQVRAARAADLDALVKLETQCFQGDRLSRRQFRYMLSRAQAALLVAVDRATAETVPTPLLGYVLVLFNRATSVARLYSLAVAAAARRRGVGRALVAAAERATWDAERAYLRLEIRRDNIASQRLFEGLRYRRFGVLSDYYDDHMEALRYEKQLSPHAAQPPARVPFYEQTLDFTCGPSSLMMAMHALDPSVTLDPQAEFRRMARYGRAGLQAVVLVSLPAAVARPAAVPDTHG